MRASKLSSSVIARVAYDEKARSIWFRETGRYIYSDVPRAIYEGLCKAPSAGRYFQECVKGKFRGSYDPARKRFGSPRSQTEARLEESAETTS